MSAVNTGRRNITIDDTKGDSATGQVPIYAPQASWEGTECTGCAIQPSTTQAFDGTWKAATYNKDLGSTNISFSFDGVALYIFFILANDQGDGITTRTECNFTLDGTEHGYFNHIPTISPLLEYNALAYSVEGLEQKTHSMLISTSGVDYNVFVNFDYAIYTYDPDAQSPASSSSSQTSTHMSTTQTSATSETASASASSDNSGTSSSSTSSSSKTPAIAGGIAGAVVLALIALVVFVICRRRRHRRGHDDYPNIDDDMDGPVMSSRAVPETAPFVVPPPTTTVTNPPTRSNPFTDPTPSRHTPTMTSRGTAFVVTNPSEDVRSVTSSGSSAVDVRHSRQQTLKRKMRDIEHEMTTLTGGFGFAGDTARDDEMSDLKSQIAAMRGQMEHLQSQLESAWAQGLSDEPPPEYSPAHRDSNGHTQ